MKNVFCMVNNKWRFIQCYRLNSRNRASITICVSCSDFIALGETQN